MRRKVSRCATSTWIRVDGRNFNEFGGIERDKEATMAAVTILRRKGDSQMTNSEQSKPVDWVNVAAGSALVVGGLLFLSEKRRAGLAVAAAGSALAVLGQQETVRSWWTQFPTVINQVQEIVGKIQHKMSELAAHRDALDDVITQAIGEEAPVGRM